MADDTNIWLNKVGTSYSVDLNDPDKKIKESEVTGPRKVQPLLGMKWAISVRRAGCDKDTETIALHTPSLVLPKANAATILSRIDRWSPYSSSDSGSGIPLGGQRAYSAFETIPLKLMLWCISAAVGFGVVFLSRVIVIVIVASSCHLTRFQLQVAND